MTNAQVRIDLGSPIVLLNFKRITVKAGFGDNTAAEFFMNSPTPMFENIDKFNGVGDGAYLLDEFGNLRFWTIYN